MNGLQHALTNNKKICHSWKEKNFSFIKQEMKKDKITMEYTWDINSVNDSVTNVSVGIKELNSIYNRTAPFF
jgi:adenine-specific DNA methylase